MDQWGNNEDEGFLKDTIQTSKSGPREPYICPVTVRQALETSEQGIEVGTQWITRLSLLGIVSCIETTSANIKFSLSDDTGVIDCLESEESEQSKRDLNLVENSYYHVFGCIKSTQGHQRLMVFNIVPVKTFNEVTLFMLQVMYMNNCLEEERNKNPEQSAVGFASDNGSVGSFETSANAFDETSLTPVQRTILDAIKSVPTVIGWCMHDPTIKEKFSSQHIEDALDFLHTKGYIYSTLDDHFHFT